MTGLTAPKLLWVRDHEPDVWRRIAHVLLPKDYVRLQLTGEYAVDKADGAGTLLFDLAARDWSPEVLDALEIPRAWLPRDVRGAGGHRPDHGGGRRGNGAAGRHAGGRGRRRSGCERGGRRRGGARAPSPCRSGTSGVVFATTNGPLFDPVGRVHAFCHAVPGRWHLMSVMLSAAGSLRWFRDTLAPGVPYDELAGVRGGGPRGQPGPPVPPLPQRRAKPASGPAGARGLRRA